jgi:hypothetical protein
VGVEHAALSVMRQCGFEQQLAALDLFISVLAHHFVHMLRLRLQLKAQGSDDSRATLRETLAVQPRVTTSLQRRDGRTVPVHKATRPEPRHHRLDTILGASQCLTTSLG